MARLPVYVQQTRVSGAGLGPGPMQRNGLAAVGQALQSSAESLSIVRERDDAADVAAGLAGLRESMTQRFVEEQGKAKPDADGFTRDMLRAFDAEALNVAQGMRSRRSGEVLRQQAKQLRAQLYERALGWEADTRLTFRTNSALDAARKLSATLELDPSQWAAAGQEQMAAIDALAVTPSERIELKRKVDDMLTEAAATGIAKSTPRLALENLSTTESGDGRFDGLSIEARHRVEQIARSRIVETEVSKVMRVYEQDGTDAGLRALEATRHLDVPDELKDDIRAGVNAQLGQLRQQRRQEHADDIASVESAISTNAAGETTRRKVETLYGLGALTPSELANYDAGIDAAVIRRAKTEAGAAEIANALAQGLPLDPRNADHRKALAAAFSLDVTGQPPGSEAWQSTAELYAQQARMLPDQALAWTRQALRSPDPTLAANAAQFFGAVAATTPDAVGELDPDTRAFAATVNSMIEAGTPPGRAVETARAIVFDVKPELLARRKAEYRDHDAKDSNSALADLIDQDFDPGLFALPPAASAALQTDFDAQASRYFEKVGDVTLARQLAWSDLKRVYGPSRVNGDAVMMAFPPERFGVTPQEIREELGNMLKGNPQADGSGSADIFVVPDALTLRAVGDALSGRRVQPSYRLVTKTGDLVVDRKGVPIRYALPSSEDLARRFREAQAAAEAKAKQQIEAARAERQRREEAARQFVERARKGELPRHGGLD